MFVATFTYLTRSLLRPSLTCTIVSLDLSSPAQVGCLSLKKTPSCLDTDYKYVHLVLDSEHPDGSWVGRSAPEIDVYVHHFFLSQTSFDNAHDSDLQFRGSD